MPEGRPELGSGLGIGGGRASRLGLVRLRLGLVQNADGGGQVGPALDDTDRLVVDLEADEGLVAQAFPGNGDELDRQRERGRGREYFGEEPVLAQAVEEAAQGSTSREFLGLLGALALARGDRDVTGALFAEAFRRVCALGLRAGGRRVGGEKGGRLSNGQGRHGRSHSEAHPEAHDGAPLPTGGALASAPGAGLSELDRLSLAGEGAA